MPLARRLPKKGFNNISFRRQFAIVNVGKLDKVQGDVVNEETLRAAGLVQGEWAGIKILGDGAVSRKLTVQVHQVSRGAQEKIAAAGGTVVELVASEGAAN